MTNADVINLIKYCDELGREIDSYRAKVVLQAREINVRDSKNAAALEVVQNFVSFLNTGIVVDSFAEFLLPCAYTDEEIAEHNRLRDAHLAWKAEHA